MVLRRAASALLLSCLSACSLLDVDPTESAPYAKDYGRPLAPGEVALEKVTDPSLYPDFGAGLRDRESLLEAIDGTLEYFAKPSSRQWFPYLDVTHERSIDSLEAFRQLVTEVSTPAELNHRIAAEYDVYRSKGWDGSGTVLFTGYCQPIYPASTVETAEFRYPVYALPPELVKADDGTPLGWDDGSGVQPSPTRAEFDAGLLAGRGLELYWLRHAIEPYIIHVQGSAKLVLEDGQERSIGYAGKTEHPYVGLGQSMVADGRIPRGSLSLFAIRRYFDEHPDELQASMHRNPSYVFFTEITGGPYGSLNIAVTPERTLATDKKVFPRGGIAFAETAVPGTDGAPRPFHQFMIDQDTGGAIRSAGRADIFLGTGPEAEHVAGGTHAEGLLWYIYRKQEPAAAEPTTRL